MSNMIRSMQRSIIRNNCYKRDGNTNAFKSEWENFHYPKTETIKEDGTIVSKVLMKKHKKNKHTDDGRLIVAKLKAFKNLISQAREEKKKKESENNNVNDVIETVNV